MPPFEPDLTEPRRRRSLLLSITFIALSGILLILPVAEQQRVSAVLRSSVLAPFLWMQESLRAASVRAVEVGEIQARLDSATALLFLQNTLQEENVRLRALLDLRVRASPSFVAASAIRAGTRGSESMFLLDVGTDQGVAVNDPVVSAAGLVGVVRQVGPRTALALDWTHPDFGVSVMTPDGVAFGIVRASPGSFREEARLILMDLPFHTELEAGELLVTSGLGTVYPRGIPVGSVLMLAEAEAGWRRSYWVRPAVHPGTATHVLVITGAEGVPASELRHLWDPGAAPEPQGDAEATP